MFEVGLLCLPDCGCFLCQHYTNQSLSSCSC